MNVLITGCSKHSKGLIDCLKKGDPNINVIGVDCNEHNLLKKGPIATYVVPKITDRNYIQTLIGICEKEEVSVIIPYITAELMLLSENAERFLNHGINVSVANPSALSVLNDKIKLNDKFNEYMPAQIVVSDIQDVRNFADSYSKVCCKISNGCGGAGFCIIDEKKAFDIALINKAGVPRYCDVEYIQNVVERTPNAELIMQEYKEGSDFSLCVLPHKKGFFHGGYIGYSMQYGAVINGQIHHNEHSVEIARDVISKTGLTGNACFDFIIDEKGNAFLLEVNPRVNASLPFLAEAGLNLPYLRCLQLTGKDISDHTYKLNYGLTMSKYYECEYRTIV